MAKELKQILNLTIQRKWFDMISSGEKKEEYRSFKNRQVVNAYIRNEKFYFYPRMVAVFRNGYRLDSEAMCVDVLEIFIRDQKIHPEHGEPDGVHFAIELGGIRKRGTYEQVREYVRENSGEQKSD